jgi:Flp pilus assembly protein TadG
MHVQPRPRSLGASRLLSRFRRDRRGVSAVEFALVSPIFILLIVGAVQMGHLFYAHAGLRNAVSEGARYATIHPRPSSEQVVQRIRANREPLEAGRYSDPTVSFNQDAATGAWYADIAMSYSLGLNFVLFHAPVTLNYSRRAYVHPEP